VSKMYVSNAKESIRLQKNPAPDALSHVHRSYPLIFWVSTGDYCMNRAVALSGDHPSQLIGCGEAVTPSRS